MKLHIGMGIFTPEPKGMCDMGNSGRQVLIAPFPALMIWAVITALTHQKIYFMYNILYKMYSQIQAEWLKNKYLCEFQVKILVDRQNPKLSNLYRNYNHGVFNDCL